MTLQQYAVTSQKIPVIGEGVIYLMDESKSRKMLRDQEERYLPVEEESEHVIFRITRAYLDLVTEGLNGQNLFTSALIKLMYLRRYILKLPITS